VKETYSYFGRLLIKINDWVAVDRLGVMPDNLLPDSLTPFPVWFFRFDSVRRAEPAARVRSGWDRILACVGKTEYPTLCEGL